MKHSPHIKPQLTTSLFAGIMILAVASTGHAQLGEPRIYSKFMAEQFEYAFNNDANPLVWDVTAWAGGDVNRFNFQSEGEMPTVGVSVEGDIELFYSRLVAPFWEFLIGVKGDLVASPEDTRGRGHLAVGIAGMSRQLFEFAPTLYVSQEGDVSFDLEIRHDLFITQRLIAETKLETGVAVQSVPEFGVGKGFNNLELGLRLRYSIVREFAPYIGVSWERSFGETADLKEAEGGMKSDVRGVAGIRFWF